MPFFDTLFETVGDTLNVFTRQIERGLTGMFGSSNARYIKKLLPRVQEINDLEGRYEKMTDEQLREQTDLFRERLVEGETLDDILPEAFAVCREAGKRVLNMRHYDVQLMGGMVLHSGAIAEMVTGEGKTLVATLPAYLNAIDGKGVHVITVNDYLARRDMEWMGPLYMSLGLTVGAIWSNMDADLRQKSYNCDITYGTNNEFGFDYLRDNMRIARKGDNRYPQYHQQCQGRLNYAIIDEVDNILIDEARTPLIISGPAHDDVNRYKTADKIARQLKRDVDFEVDEKDRTAHMTEVGVRTAEKLAGVESFYTAGNMEWPHLIDNSLKAHHLYKRDVNYLIEGDEIVIIDEFTGRKMPGRNWSDGLHQAVEAKENVRVKKENQTLATITLQNYFKLYTKISGMTGTAMTEASEFYKIYGLDVIAIPTNRVLQRLNHPDVIYRTEDEKYRAVAEEIERISKWDVITLDSGTEIWGTIQSESDGELVLLPKGQKKKETIPRSKISSVEYSGRPILVGTVSVERSEQVSRMLDQRGIKHQVLNAKYHGREAEIVAQAGRKGAVTIATNMAGRGTDIILGGNPEAMAWAILQEKYESRLDIPQDEWNKLVDEIEQREQMKPEGEVIRKMGGLHIIGTERHEARRIDLQLRGRCGRQGDPGSSRFFLSLKDDLMRIFAGEWVEKILTGLGMEEGQAIESKMVSRRIEGAQKKVEEKNFEIRKHLLEYDEVMDEQRKRVYAYRQRILDGADCKTLIFEMIDEQIEYHLNNILDKEYGPASFAQYAANRLGNEFDARDFRNISYDLAEEYAKDHAKRMADGKVLDAIEENLPDSEDESDWNWQALAKWANTQFGSNLRDRDLRQVGYDGVAELIIAKANDFIDRVDLSGGQHLLEPDFGARTACNWVKVKFDIELDFDEIKDLDPDLFKQQIREKAHEKYDEKECEFPVHVALLRYTVHDPGGHKRYDREPLAAWTERRFGVELTADELKNKQRHEIRETLVEQSRIASQHAEQSQAEALRQIDKAFAAQPGLEQPDDPHAMLSSNNPEVAHLSCWLNESIGGKLSETDILGLERVELTDRITSLVEERYRPEMQRLERSLVLQLLDAAWKEHLLTMDHLRSSVGLVGYSQRDPKVEYKREGMSLFAKMWTAVGERVTDLIFRVEQLDEGFVSSTWQETAAIHEEAAPATDGIREQQQAAIEGSEAAGAKAEPFRRKNTKVGRNDPCPCGSGKKYKSCCGKSR